LDGRGEGWYKTRMARHPFRSRFLAAIGAEQLIAVFELMPEVSFFIKDAQGRFVALNRRAWEYCGAKSEADAIGKTDADFFPIARATEYRHDDLAVLSGGQPIVNRVEGAPELAGSPRVVLTCKIPLRDRRGRIVGLAGFSRAVDQVRERPIEVARLTAAIARMHDASGERLGSTELAAQSGLSVSQFDRVFRKHTGTSPRQYLLRTRIDGACRRLAQTNDTIAAIASEFGFHDHSHFVRTFRRLLGTTPSEYRVRHQRPAPAR
jgi:AraC-like DNA-binding protein